MPNKREWLALVLLLLALGVAVAALTKPGLEGMGLL